MAVGTKKQGVAHISRANAREMWERTSTFICYSGN